MKSNCGGEGEREHGKACALPARPMSLSRKVLAQIIIIKKPHRSKGFIKQNMSWAFGSSCPQSGKHTFKSGGRQTPCILPAARRFQGAGRVCDSVSMHVCTCVHRDSRHKPAFSFHAYFTDVISDIRCDRTHERRSD